MNNEVHHGASGTFIDTSASQNIATLIKEWEMSTEHQLASLYNM